jgi:alanine dehydrogenase
MNIGVPKERRPFEFRVGLPPAGVELFTRHGHAVLVETGAGEGAGFSDEDYIHAGATIQYTTEEVFGRADLILKFTRPLQDELFMMMPGQTLTGFLHLAAARQERIDLLIENKLTSIAYEQVQEPDGYRPLLTPLSQIGGQMAVQVASTYLQTDHGGRGTLLGGVPGVPPAEIVIIGAGNAGRSAARSFAGVGAHVTLLDIDLRKLQDAQDRLNIPMVTMLSTPFNLRRACSFADVVIGAVLVPGAMAPTVLTREMVRNMKPRTVFIDISIDQGGCAETSRPTNHGSPTYIEEGVIHYCVPNMSGVLGRTATHALFLSAYPYLELIARVGIQDAIQSSTALEKGVNTLGGEIVHLHRLNLSGEGDR